MKFSTNLAPVMECLEPRQLLSGSGWDAALAGGDSPALASGSAALYASRSVRGMATADAWQHAGVQPGGSGAGAPVLAQSPVAAAPTPGASLTAQVVNSGGTTTLVVLGTENADTLTVSQVGGFTTIRTPTGIQLCPGAFRNISIYGFGGNDSLTVCFLVTANVNVYGGDGDDNIYDAGQGNDILYGEAGDDLIVSIGGGTDRASGGDGSDAFWVDGGDPVADASFIENTALAVHRVTQFINGASANCCGQNLPDPALGSYAARYANFSSMPLFTDGPTFTDIRQGMLGDCYFLAALGSMATADPSAIRQSITSLGDGTYAVRFFRNGVASYVRVDGDLPVSSGGGLSYAGLSGTGEAWAPLMEKAYAIFRAGANSYKSIEGGWMGSVYTEITNRLTASVPTIVGDSLMYTFLAACLAGGRAVTAGSKAGASGPIVGSHAYQVRDASQSGGQMFVTLYNPWGIDGGSGDANPFDGLITLTMSQFRDLFSSAVATI
jgi:hypothetical protein